MTSTLFHLKNMADRGRFQIGDTDVLRRFKSIRVKELCDGNQV